MTDDSARLHLPMMQAGQAQKEATHNEALALLDLAAQASVVAIDVNTPPGSPAIGQCWIVGSQPVGAWTGRAGALAGWTTGGWRFLAAREGMVVALEGGMTDVRYHAGGWTSGVVGASQLVVDGLRVVGPRRPAIAGPTGGDGGDAAARVAIGQILESLREHGLIAP